MSRPPSKQPKLDEKFSLMLKKDVVESIRQRARLPEYDNNMSLVVRRGIEHELYGKLPVLGRIPCGPLKAAVERTDHFKSVGDALRWKAGDFLLEADGDSMSPKIESGDLVLLRPG